MKARPILGIFLGAIVGFCLAMVVSYFLYWS